VGHDINKMRIQFGIAVGLLFWVVPRIAGSHHSVGGFFDINQTVEIEGVVTATIWRNPHTVFEVDVDDPSGEVIEWHVETGALGVLQVRGLDREFMRVGDRIRIFGNPSNRGLNEIWANNVRLNNGQEVLVSIMARPYFSLQEGGTLLEPIYDELSAEIERTARRDADGVFRVWSANLRPAPGDGRVFNGNYPINDAARVNRETWNQNRDIADVDLLGCHEFSMPSLMSNPAPMEFVREGSDILMRFFYGDNERIIYMDPDTVGVPSDHSLMGHSIGRWDGDTLVVETTNMRAGRLDGGGTPHSSNIHIVERFTPSADRARLDYEINVMDSEYFTESFEQSRHWFWRPEMALGRYACEEAQQLPPIAGQLIE
jgi:hypothetical protein